MTIDMTQVDHLIELRGVYDGWSIAVMKDGTAINRWTGKPGWERLAAATDVYMNEQDLRR